jgi:hypothetical protein
MTTATAVCEAPAMADKAPKTIPVRLTEEAIKWARIASGYTGESMATYISRTVAERGMEDAERLHPKAMAKAPKPKGTSK